MKLADLRNPVRFDWLADQGFRLDASPYLSGAYEARKLLEAASRNSAAARSGADPRGNLSFGPEFARRWVTDPEYGVPFLSSTDILEADFSISPFDS